MNKNNDCLGIKGTYTIYEYDAKTGKLLKEPYSKSNLITNLLKSNFIKMLNFDQEGSPTANNFFDLQYLALGDGTTPPVVGNTTLENELFRKVYTQKNVLSSQEIEFLVSLGTQDANFTATEIGIFANGSGLADTGSLMSRTLLTIDKNENKIINVYYRLELV